MRVLTVGSISDPLAWSRPFPDVIVTNSKADPEHRAGVPILHLGESIRFRGHRVSFGEGLLIPHPGSEPDGECHTELTVLSIGKEPKMLDVGSHGEWMFESGELVGPESEASPDEPEVPKELEVNPVTPDVVPGVGEE